MNNARIADAFDQMADLLEFKSANPFRVRAYRNAARVIREFPEPLAAIVEDPSRALTEIPGIGDDLADKIETLLTTDSLPQLDELRREIPASVLDLLRVPGLGPKKAAVLFQEQGIATLDQLQAACEAGQVRTLKGFGKKTEEKILHGIAIAAAANARMLWADADEIARLLREHLAVCDSVEQLELAGSYRRGKETVGDLDLLVVSADVPQVMDRLATLPELAEVQARGETKMSIRTQHGLQVDLRVVPRQSFGAALQYFTGSKEHNVVLRGMAKDRGLKINEYGVFRLDGNQEHYVAGEREADVYAALDLPWIPPELREARQEFDWCRAGQLPKLIQVADIRGDLHLHTSETDGQATLAEMVAAAKAAGLEYIAITDHSQRVAMARGLNSERLRAQWRQIDAWNAHEESEFVVLKGIECDILEAGGMDLPDDVLAEADWVLASVHYGQHQSRDQITARILGALANPFVSAIAHPTGRLLNRREAYEVDLEAVFQAAREHGKLLELNANPWRLDLDDAACAAAKRAGIPLVINTDAHSTSGLGTMRYGVVQARRGGLTAADVANCLPLKQLRRLLPRSHKQPAE